MSVVAPLVGNTLVSGGIHALGAVLWQTLGSVLLTLAGMEQGHEPAALPPEYPACCGTTDCTHTVIQHRVGDNELHFGWLSDGKVWIDLGLSFHHSLIVHLLLQLFCRKSEEQDGPLFRCQLDECFSEACVVLRWGNGHVHGPRCGHEQASNLVCYV
jgi:hypothetical protein